MSSSSIPSAPQKDQLPPPYVYPAMQEPFSFRVAENLLKFSASVEGTGKPSAIDQELAELIKSRSMEPVLTQINFERDIEKISLGVSSSGEVFLYSRKGGPKIVDRNHGSPAEITLSDGPLANYTFVSLSLPPRSPERPAAAASAPKIDEDPKIIATALAASYIGFSNLILASLVNFGAAQLSEGKVPLSTKNVFVAGAILAFTPPVLLDTLAIGGAVYGAYQLAGRPDGMKVAAKKAEELKNAIFEGSKTALKIGAELASHASIAWNLAMQASK